MFVSLNHARYVLFHINIPWLSVPLFFLLYCTVNVAHDISQSLQGTASMSEHSFPDTQWEADKVVDGNTAQTATAGSCAIIDFSKNYNSVWLKVQLGRPFNVAYIQIFFRNEQSMFLSDCVN